MGTQASARWHSGKKTKAVMAFLVAAILGTLSLAVLVVPASEAQSTPPANCLPSGSQVVCTFGYTGAAQSWTVPEGVSQATFDVFGAPGGRVNGFGGFGGRVRATLTVTPGATYQILVGGERGFNGGGAPGDTDPAAGAGGAAGGGASDVRTGAYGLADRLLVAGGGGGAGTLVENPGGDGGHPNGGAGVAPPNLRGGGGTQTAGGAGAIGAGNGSLGQGGDGADSLDRGGGGGGGYYGGGGGAEGLNGYPGGGGSSYATPAATDVGFENGVRGGVRELNGLVTITYTPNRAPVANDDSATTDEDTLLTGNVLANDTDPDGDTLKAALVDEVENGSLTLNLDGSFSYEPNADYNGPDSFTYTVSNGKGGTNTASVNLTVSPVNDDPTATNGTASMAEDAAPITIDFADLVSDVETSDANLAYIIVSGPSAQQGTLTGSGSTRTFDSAENFNGTVTIDYKVTDRGDPDDCTGAPGAGCDAPKDSETKSVTITVTPVNDAPTVAVTAGGACGTNDRSGTINLTVSDPDGQAQPDSLKLGATSSNMALVPNANLTFGGSGASRTLTATAVSGKTGTATITVTVSDGTATGMPLALTLKAGGNSNDTLADTSGTNTTDILLGQNGDDTLRGVGGRDLLCGGRGNDRLSGGADADRFEGGSGTDTATDFNASQGDSRVGIP